MIGREVAAVNNRGSSGLGEGGGFAAELGGGGRGEMNQVMSLRDKGVEVLVGVV